MKLKILIILFSFIVGGVSPFFVFAQTAEVEEAVPLEKAKGRIFEMEISSQKYLILSAEKGNYLLKTDFRKELLSQLQEIALKNWEAEINGIFKGYREFKIINFKEQQNQKKDKELEKEGRKASLRVIDVVLINSINKEVAPKEAPNLFTTFTVPPDFLKDYSQPFNLKRIAGKVSKCNFKAVIPSIELKDKPDLPIMIPGDVEAVKVMGGNLMAFKPKDAIKEGTEVEIWYEEKEGINTARIITIKEKDITTQTEQ